MKLLIFISLFFALNCNNENNRTSNEKDNTLVYLAVAKEEFQPNEKVNINFRVKNNSKDDLEFCYWHTPFENDFTADFFEIKCDGAILPYKGILIKRKAPVKDDYIKLKPGKVISHEIELNKGYDIGKPGKYTVKFLGSDINKLPDSDSISFIIAKD
ncbi:MAG: hypothetical protein GY756_23345 [bacterium]|nr:hypothetical protein [bacterium]